MTTSDKRREESYENCQRACYHDGSHRGICRAPDLPQPDCGAGPGELSCPYAEVSQAATLWLGLGYRKFYTFFLHSGVRMGRALLGGSGESHGGCGVLEPS